MHLKLLNGYFLKLPEISTLMHATPNFPHFPDPKFSIMESQNPKPNPNQPQLFNGQSQHQSTNAETLTGNNPGVNWPRGVKRPREQLAQCDCDDVDIPLSKRINGLNIEQNSGSNSSGHPARQRTPTPSTFQESYPYDASAPYYSANHLLYHLYLERVQRQQRQQFDTQQTDK